MWTLKIQQLLFFLFLLELLIWIYLSKHFLIYVFIWWFIWCHLNNKEKAPHYVSAQLIGERIRRQQPSMLTFRLQKQSTLKAPRRQKLQEQTWFLLPFTVSIHFMIPACGKEFSLWDHQDRYQKALIRPHLCLMCVWPLTPEDKWAHLLLIGSAFLFGRMRGSVTWNYWDKTR